MNVVDSVQERVTSSKEDILNSVDCFQVEELKSITSNDSQFIEFKSDCFHSIMYLTNEELFYMDISETMILEGCDASYQTTRGKIFCFN